VAGDKAWQLAFWLITTVCGIWLLALTQGVIASDRINTADHKELRECIFTQLQVINERLARIETIASLDQSGSASGIRRR